MQHRQQRAFALPVLIAFSLSSPVLLLPVLCEREAAAEATESELAAARDLFRDGLALEETSHWSEARDRFERVGKVKMTAAVRFHLGLCSEKLGFLVAALNDFMRSESEAAAETGSDAALIGANAKRHIDDLRARIPMVVVVVPKGVGAKLAIDGNPIPDALLETPIPLDPGDHVVRVTAPKSEPFEEKAHLAPRDPPRRIVVTLSPASSDIEPPAPKPSSSSSLGAAPWIAFGISGVAALSAGVMYGLRASAVSHLDDACGPDRAHCADDQHTLYEHGRTYTLAGNVLVGVAAAAGLTGIALVLFDGPKSNVSGAGGSNAKQGQGTALVIGGAGPFSLGLAGAF